VGDRRSYSWLVSLMTLTSIAVIVFFGANADGESPWQTVLAPASGCTATINHRPWPSVPSSDAQIAG
jgi:hypothetical protein